MADSAETVKKTVEQATVAAKVQGEQFKAQAEKVQAAGTQVLRDGLEKTSASLAELSAWCADRLGPHEVAADPAARPNDIPWLVLDHARASQAYAWQPAHDRFTIFEEIAAHAEAHPDWLDRVAG